MRLKSSFFPILVLATVLTSCISISEVRPTEIPIPTNTPAPTITPLPTQRTEPEQANLYPNNKVAYRLEAEMNYDLKTILVNESIEFTNGTGLKLDTILLAIPPNSVPGVLKMVQVSINDQVYDDFELDGERLLIKGLALPNADTVELDVRFKLTLPELIQGDPNLVRPKIFGVTDQQVNLTDWYAMVTPYDPERGWIHHDPGFYGEHLVYPISDLELILTFEETPNLPMIASSTSPTVEGLKYSFKAPNGRDFALSMGRTMNLVSDISEDITVNSYYFLPYQAAAEAVLQTTMDAITLYTKLFGPIDRDTISAVQGDFDDGMEFDGLYYLSASFYNLYDGNADQYLVMVAAHETCHQWWFGKVANDQALHPWMDESLATYCEILFYENYYPELVDWWWFTRVNFYEPTGFIDQDIYTYQGFTPYTNATYRQGARFLEELRTLMGDEAFFAFMRQYSDELKNKVATPQDFFRILRENTSADLEGLISTYFQGTY